MILNKRDYLKEVFSLDLSYETEKMIAARRDFLAGNTHGAPAVSLARRQELYWSLQEFRHEFWSLSASKREAEFEELSMLAPPEFKISLEHLQQVSGLEEEIKKLEKDLDFDPLFVERLKSRILWSNNAIPGTLELRTAIPAKTDFEFHQIQKSVATLQEKYPQFAHIVPQWLEMIKTSEKAMEALSPTRRQYVDKQAEEEWKKSEKKEAEEQLFGGIVLALCSLALLIYYLFG